MAGLSQEQLAFRSGIGRGTIQLIEGGKTEQPHPETLSVLAKTLGVPMSELVVDEAACDSADTCSATLAVRAPFGRLPPRPVTFVGRLDDVELLRRHLIAESLRTETTAMTVVHGWPGVGKTTLAAHLCRDPELEAHFTDGVLWCSLGQNPDVRGELSAWERAVDPSCSERRSESTRELSQRLTHQVRGSRILLVIDDVWTRDDLELLRIGGELSATLITTRQASLADELGSAERVHRLKILDEAESLALLQVLVPELVAKHLEACREVMHALEGLPLAVRVAAALLRAEVRRGFDVEKLLRELTEDLLPVYRAPTPLGVSCETTPTVSKLLQKSTDLLAPITRRRFAQLGELAPKPAVFDASTAAAAWNVQDPRTDLAELVDRGLLEVLDRGLFQMHSLLRTHAQSLWDDADGAES